MSIIKIQNLSFSYEDSTTKIFNRLNLDLDSSWKLGLVGRNGRGKTTFLNLLRGRLNSNGHIQTQLTFSYFPCQIKNPDDITLYQLQEQVAFEEWQLKRELNLMNVDPDLLWQPFKTLSGGEQTKILLALSFVNQDSFALIDEPTNHLDDESRTQIANYLSKHKQGYIVVSHDRAFLNQVTNHILAIENNEIHLYQGNYANYENTKSLRDRANQAQNQKLMGEISDLRKSAFQAKQFSQQSEKNKTAAAHRNELHANINKGFFGHKAAKLMKRSKSLERRLEDKATQKEGLLTNIEEVPELTMNFIANYHQRLLEVHNLALDVNGKHLFKGLNFVVNNHGITALTGKNGTGKSTFLKFLQDQAISQASGKVIMVNDLRISYLPQIFTGYSGTLKDFAEQFKISYSALLNTLKKMGFPRTSFSSKIEELSMGQQKRVAIARSLVEPADLYLWDEPANYLDVFNQDQLIKLLKTVQPAMILVEHDQYFIDQVAKNKINLTNLEISN